MTNGVGNGAVTACMFAPSVSRKALEIGVIDQSLPAVTQGYSLHRARVPGGVRARKTIALVCEETEAMCFRHRSFTPQIGGSMATASLTLHKGARRVERPELNAVPCPTFDPHSRWRPVAHGAVLQMAESAIQSAGFGVQKMELGLSRCDQKFWGTFVLDHQMVEGVSLSMLVSSSTDMTIALRAGFGSRVWACDNGAWTAERTISRKHTIHSVERYFEAVCKTVSELPQFAQVEGDRITRMMGTPITDQQAESYLLRAFEKGILSHRTLLPALEYWRTAEFPGQQEKTAWRLYNSVSGALKGLATANPQRHIAATIQAGAFLLN